MAWHDVSNFNINGISSNGNHHPSAKAQWQINNQREAEESQKIETQINEEIGASWQ